MKHKNYCAGGFSSWDHAECGFTLIESMVALAILLLVLVPLSSFQQPIFAATERAGEYAAAGKAIMMIKAELDGVNYYDPDSGVSSIGQGPEESSRTQYDDIDDYQNYNQSPIHDKDGGQLHGIPDSFRIKITTTFVSPADPMIEDPTARDATMVTVQVLKPDSTVIRSFFTVYFRGGLF